MALMMQLWFSSSEMSAVSAVIRGTMVEIDRGVGRGEDHRGFAAVERRQARLEGHVGRVGAADEAHRARAAAVFRHRRFLGLDHARAGSCRDSCSSSS
jgi:hypothetical protein